MFEKEIDFTKNSLLFVKNINMIIYQMIIINDEYNYFSNRVIIDEDIFYTFTKNIKKINRLTIKNYGV